MKQVQVTVDARLKVDCRELEAPVIAAIKEIATHTNPQHSKLKAMGYATHNEPRIIRTWKGGPGWVALPRGVLSRLRACLAEHGCQPVFDDRRTDPNPIDMPRHRVQLYDYQDDGVRRAIDMENCLFKAGTGCIAGDAMISINRGGKGWTLRLDDLVKMQNDGVRANRKWDERITTMVRARGEDGVVKLVRLREAYASGVKPVYELQLLDGRVLKATADHRFYTTRDWVRLGELTLQDEVFVEESKLPQKRASRSKHHYLVRRVRFHPYAGRNIACRTHSVGIASITRVGEEPTYDLSLDAPHNFLANGIVVHNSGKTTAAMALISRIRVPSLVIVWNAALLEQWEERVCKEFGIPASDIGIIRAGKVRMRPITLAMQQSLAKLGEADRKAVGSYFGAVVCDEVHRFAAKTFVEVIDWIPARYRVGMSADEKRKDSKEFLIYDMFGRVAFEVDNAVLVEKKFVLDVAVHVHPTGSPYDWYQLDEVPYSKLIEAIEVDDARTALAADLAAAEVQAGHQVMVFSHRREHCHRLAAALAARGVQAGIMLGGPESAGQLDQAIRGLRSGKLRVAVGTVQAVGTGIDLPSVSRGVLTTPIPSNKQLFGQVRGRLCRTAPGKTDAVLHYLYDERAFGGSVLRNLERWNDSVLVRNGKSVTSVRDYLSVLSGVHADVFKVEDLFGED